MTNCAESRVNCSDAGQWAAGRFSGYGSVPIGLYIRTASFNDKGIIAKHTSEVEISDLRNIVANQGIVERICGLGSVGLSTAGQSGFEIEMRGVVCANSADRSRE